MKSVIERIKRNRAVSTALAVQRRYGEDDGGYLAAAISYYGFLSLFPLMLVGASALGFALAGAPEIRADLIERLSRSVPGLGSAIGENLDTLQNGRAATGLVGIAGLLWSGTGAVQAAGYALDRVARRPPTRRGRSESWYRSMIRDRAWALSSTVLLGVLALAGVGLAALAPVAGGAAGIALAAAAGLGAFAVDVAAFLLAYRLLSRGATGLRSRGATGLLSRGATGLLSRGTTGAFRSLRPGAIVAATGWTILKLAGSWYVGRTVAQSSAAYGTFASTVGVLILLYLAARLFVYGAEINAVLADGRASVAGRKTPVPREATRPRARLGATRTG